MRREVDLTKAHLDKSDEINSWYICNAHKLFTCMLVLQYKMYVNSCTSIYTIYIFIHKSGIHALLQLVPVFMFALKSHSDIIIYRYFSDTTPCLWCYYIDYMYCTQILQCQYMRVLSVHKKLRYEYDELNLII